MTKRKTPTRKPRSKPKRPSTASKSKTTKTRAPKAKAGARKTASKAKSAPKAKTRAKSASKAASKAGPKAKAASKAKKKATQKTTAKAKTTKAKPANAAKGKAVGKASKRRTNGSQGKAPKRPLSAAAAKLEEVATGPGPRMQQILQATIEPWKRDTFSDEEAQLREIKRIPVRNVFDSEEARKRLVGRTATQAKRRFSRSRGSNTSKSASASSN